MTAGFMSQAAQQESDSGPDRRPFAAQVAVVATDHPARQRAEKSTANGVRVKHLGLSGYQGSCKTCNQQ